MISPLLTAIYLAGSLTGLSPDLPVSYEITVELDTTGRKLYGFQNIRFLNPTDGVLDKICFHLYPNAFSDTVSVFCVENEQARADVASGNIARLDVSEINIDGLAVDLGRIDTSGTLMYIALRDALLPGRDLNISMRFELTIPRARVRFGHNGKGDYLFAHWYPILCGYQKNRLIDREYHANSEFFSNFGSYDVTMKLPSNLIVGSTGLLSLAENSDTLAVWRARADTVIDFAFACGKNFERFQSDAPGVRISYLLSGDNAALSTRIDDITKFSLDFCSERLFPYPYSDFTVVDFNSGSAGMELPGMIVVSIPDEKSRRLKASFESLIAHETVHEWFYGMIATNEIDEPWLDEGLTSYFTSKIMAARPDTSFDFTILGYGVTYGDLSRIFALSRRPSYPLNLASFDYPGWYEYESTVYSRAEMVLRCLEMAVGDTVFSKALQEYARKHRFDHPDTEEFERAISAAAKKDLSGFYSQFIRGTSRVDYAVSALEFKEVENPVSPSPAYRITVDLRREHDGILPQVITVRLDDGSIIDTTWDGVSRIARFEFEAGSRPQYAAIDEYSAYPLDESRANDRLYLESQSSRLITFDWDSVFIIEFILSLFL